jgi:hypothetical protein
MKVTKTDIKTVLNSYGQEGVAALTQATPIDSGLAASSWGYEVSRSRKGWAITWINHDIENGFPVVIMLQYGHGTQNGGYVKGRDFINPAIRPIFDRISHDVWKAVTSA